MDSIFLYTLYCRQWTKSYFVRFKVAKQLLYTSKFTSEYLQAFLDISSRIFNQILRF